MKNRIIIILISLSLLLNSFTNMSYAESKTIKDLSEKQKNSLMMLNYLVVLSKKINSSKNSRLYLEEAYKFLFNNINAEAINDVQTQSFISDLMDTIHNYRMIDKKRERLQYVYEQNKAETLKDAIPNPIGLLSAVKSDDLIKLAGSIVYMAIDAKTSYDKANSALDLKYLQDGWNLDDEEANNLHNNMKKTWNYRVDIVKKYNIPNQLTLTEENINDFVEYAANENIAQRIQFFESNKTLYQGFVDYWIALIDSYYKNKQFNECVASAEEYEKLHVGIFNKQYDFVRVLPLVISSLYKIGDDFENLQKIKKYCDFIEKNTNDSDWDLRYFVAQTYLYLYNGLLESELLDKAYNITLTNVRFLVKKQEEKNNEYLADVRLQEKIKNAKTKKQKQDNKDIEKYNKLIKEERKRALAPIYKPFFENCKLLFALSKKLNKSKSEQEKIDAILHTNGQDIFLIKPIDEMFRFNKKGYHKENIEFDGKKLKIPIKYVTLDTHISTVINDNGTISFDDWKLEKVEREDNKNIDKFYAIYLSETAKRHKFSENSSINFNILPKKDFETGIMNFEFKISKDGFLPIKTVKFKIKS